MRLPVSATVVSNGPKAVIASNEGMPVITKFPREKISTDLHQLATNVTETGIDRRRDAPLVVPLVSDLERVSLEI